MDKELNKKQKAFIDAYIDCGNKLEAFKRAGYKMTDDKTPYYYSNQALKRFNHPAVQAEIKRREALIKEATDKAIIEKAANIMEKWSREDSIDALKEIYHTSAHEMRKEIYDDDGNVNGYTYNPAAANQARGAIDSINKMLGYNEPEKSQVDATVSVDLGEFKEFAK